jgi:hypothetical protein
VTLFPQRSFYTIFRIFVSAKKWYLNFRNYSILDKQGFGSGPTLKSKFGSFRNSKWSRGGPWTFKMEAWRLKMETRRVFRLVVADSHHLDENRDLDPDRLEVKSWIRIRIKVRRIRNPVGKKLRRNLRTISVEALSLFGKCKSIFTVVFFQTSHLLYCMACFEYTLKVLNSGKKFGWLCKKYLWRCSIL